MLPVPATFPGFQPGERVLPRVGRVQPGPGPAGREAGPRSFERETSDSSPREGCACCCLDVLLGSKSGQQPQKAPPPPLLLHILPGKRSAGLPGVGGGGSLSFLFF